MLAIQRRRAQIELQAHRHWLGAFVVRSSRDGRSSVRSFSSSHRYGLQQEQELEQEQTRNIARARARADAEHRKKQQLEKQGQHEGGAAAPGSKLSDAKRRKRERWEARRSGPHTVELQALGLREDLLTAVKERNTDVVFRSYRELPERRPLAAEDFRAIAQCAHQALRSENQQPQHLQRPEHKQDIVAFADLLAKDVRQGNILPSRQAHVHLLGIFKESGYLEAGIMFWKWLEPQDDQHVGCDTYGVAIELLAIHGAPSEHLESLYEKALLRFPGNFSAYHLSPNALLPDRETDTTVKRLPVGLLQAITAARLMRGNSRQAYLALDTVFRLFPRHVDSRFIKLFLEERPVSEAYTVIALACRAGMALPSAILRTLVPKLLRITAHSHSAQHHICSLRAMLAAMYLHLGATGKAYTNSLVELITATTSIFRLPGVDSMDIKQRKKLEDAVLLSVRQIFEIFARFGIRPTAAALNSVIMNIAGYGRSKEALGIVLRDFETLNITPTDVTRRTVLTIAGMWGDQEMVEDSWNKIVEARRVKLQWPDLIDFVVLSKSVKATGKVSFARKQFDDMKMFIPQVQHRAIDYAITKAYVRDIISGKEPVSFDELYEGTQKLHADLAVFELETRGGLKIHDFSDKHLPLTTLLPPEGALEAPEEVIRHVYDEMTLDPATISSVSRDSASAGSDVLRSLGMMSGSSGTNITLGDLRYGTWKNINNLLQLAEKHDATYAEIVDTSIAQGEKPSEREMGFTQEELSSITGFGLSELRERPKKSRVTVDEYRTEVRRLRGMGVQ